MKSGTVINARYIVRTSMSDRESNGTCLVDDRLDGEQVVLKWARGGDRLEAGDLLNEFKLLTSLRHPFIVEIGDLGFDAALGVVYLTTRRIEGSDLAGWWAEKGTARGLRPLVVNILRALSALHASGLVHGDIKPANILVVDDSPRIIDFGFAAHEGAGHARGTLPYMAPEVMSGSAPDVLSDVFSLGASIWHVMTGSPWSESVLSAEKLLELHPGLDGDFAALVVAMVGADRAGRPSSPAEILELMGVREHSVAWQAVLPFVGRETLIEQFGADIAARPLLVVRGPTGSGKTSALTMLRWMAQLDRWCALAGSATSATVLEELDRLADVVSGPRAVLLVDDCPLLTERLVDEVREWIRSRPEDVVVILAATDVDRTTAQWSIDLPPLEPEQQASVIRTVLGKLDGAVMRRVIDLTGGSPVVLEHVVRFLSSKGWLPSVYERESLIDDELADSLLGRLSPQLSKILTWLAVLETPTSVRILENLVADLDVASLEELARLHLAARSDEGWAVAGEIVSDAVLRNRADLPPMYTRASEIPEATDVERLVRLLASSVPVDLETIQDCVRAHPSDAEMLLWAALTSSAVTRDQKTDLCPGFLESRMLVTGSREIRALIASDLSDYLADGLDEWVEASLAYREGRTGEAEAILEKCLAGGRQLHRCSELLVRILVKTGRYRAAVNEAEHILERLGPSARMVGLLYSMARAHYFLTDHGEARRRVEMGLDLCESERDAIVGHGLLAMLSSATGRLVESRKLYANALERLGRADWDDPALESGYLLNLALVLQQMGRPTESIPMLEKVVTISRRAGLVAQELASITNLANIDAWLCKERTCSHRLQEARLLARRTDSPLHEAQLDLVEAELRLNLSDATGGSRSLTRARERFEALELSDRVMEVLLVEGFFAVQEEDGGRVGEILNEIRSGELPEHLQGRYLHLEAMSRPRGLPDRLNLLWEAHARAGGWESEASVLSDLCVEYDRIGDKRMAEATAAFGHALLFRAIGGEPTGDAGEFYRVRWRRALLEGAQRRGESEQGATTLAQALELQRRIVEETDSSHLLDLIMDAAVEMTGSERGFLILREERERMEIGAARNIDRETIRKAEFEISRTIAEDVLSSGVPLLSVSAQDDEILSSVRSVHLLGLKSVLCVPVRGRERVRGAIYLDNRLVKGVFGQSHMQTAIALADTLAVAMENIELREKLEHRKRDLADLNKLISRQLLKKENEVTTLRREVARTRGELHLDERFPWIIGRSRAMERVLSTVDKVAPSSLPVLIEGETGTGKELVARAVHAASDRSERPFIPVNCGALTETLLASELFGHVKGAFTGAARERRGLIRESTGGTLFLDELQSMSPGMQTRLLRVLERGEVTPVGSERIFNVDIRIIAATNVAPSRLVDEGSLREDLYYRLDVITIALPPLRERTDDIPILVEYFLGRSAKTTGRHRKQLSPAGLAAMMEHRWPGNVRQLENVVTAAALTSETSVIDAGDLPDTLLIGSRLARTQGRYAAVVEDSEREAIVRALQRTAGNKTRAAALLGVSRVTLYRKLDKLQISLDLRDERH